MISLLLKYAWPYGLIAILALAGTAGVSAKHAQVHALRLDIANQELELQLKDNTIRALNVTVEVDAMQIDSYKVDISQLEQELQTAKDDYREQLVNCELTARVITKVSQMPQLQEPPKGAINYAASHEILQRRVDRNTSLRAFLQRMQKERGANDTSGVCQTGSD